MTGLMRGLQPYSPNWKNHGTGGGTSFTLDVSSTTNATLLMVGGVVQLPGTDYTVSGTTVTTTTSVTSGVEVISAVLYDLGSVTTPAAGSVNFDALGFTSQAQGDILYRDSSAWARLPAGTSGQFLKTQGAGANPTWAAASGDFVLLATNTLSTASTSDFTAFDNATYNSYLFIFTNIVTSSDGSHFICKTSTDGGSSYDTGYAHANFQNNTNTGGGVTDTEAEGAGSVELTATNNWGNAANEQLAGELRLYNPGATAHCKMTWQIGYDDDQAGAYWTCEVGAAKRETAADVDAIQFLSSSGTITGTIKMYGLK